MDKTIPSRKRYKVRWRLQLHGSVHRRGLEWMAMRNLWPKLPMQLPNPTSSHTARPLLALDWQPFLPKAAGGRSPKTFSIGFSAGLSPILVKISVKCLNWWELGWRNCHKLWWHFGWRFCYFVSPNIVIFLGNCLKWWELRWRQCHQIWWQFLWRFCHFLFHPYFKSHLA